MLFQNKHAFENIDGKYSLPYLISYSLRDIRVLII